MRNIAKSAQYRDTWRWDKSRWCYRGRGFTQSALKDVRRPAKTFSTVSCVHFSKEGSKAARLTKTLLRPAHRSARTQRNPFDVARSQFATIRWVAELADVFVETRKEAAMRIPTTRRLAMRLAFAVAFAPLQATLATTALATPSYVHHHSAPAASTVHRANHSSWRNPTTGYATDPTTVLRPQYYYPNPFAGECTEDEGYGRYKLCDSGP
jgi:hypothetical protein